MARHLALGLGAPGMLKVAGWSFFGGIGALVAGFLLLGWRLRKWEQGEGPDCDRCGGPQGWIRSGKVYRGRQLPDYRTCYNCGKDAPAEAR